MVKDRVFGTKWVDVGNQVPQSLIEIKCPALATLLSERKEFEGGIVDLVERNATKGGATTAGTAKGGEKAERSPMPGSVAEKRLKEEEKKKAAEEAAKEAEVFKILDEATLMVKPYLWLDMGKSYTVKLTNPTGLIFEKNDSAAKGIFVKRMENTNPANKFAFDKFDESKIKLRRQKVGKILNTQHPSMLSRSSHYVLTF